MPIVLKNGDIFGNLCAFDSQLFSFSEQHIKLLETMATFMAYIIDLESIAIHDPLTGVYNRTFIKEYFTELEHIEGQRCAVLFLDLDNFKSVNDTYKHDVGDLILQEVAGRMKSCIRESDMIARLGGDEFIIILPSISKDQLRVCVDRISEILSAPYCIQNHEIALTASIGISLYPFDGQDIDTLIKKADLSMYQAKEKGKACIEYYEKIMDIQKPFTKEELKSQYHSLIDNHRELEEVIRNQSGMIFKYKKENDRFIHTYCDGEMLYRMGLSPGLAVGKELLQLIPKDMTIVKEKMYEKAWSGQEVSYEGQLAGINYIANFKPLLIDGIVTEVTVYCIDITEKKKAEELANYLAYYDELTQLPNRNHFYKKLKDAIDTALQKKQQLVVMYLDLDRFKIINESLGFSVGDQLLRMVGERLVGCTRKMDLLSRLGGDEFALLIPKTRDINETLSFARNLLDAFKEPFTLVNQELSIVPSIGIAIYPNDADNSEDLMKRADTAMYRAKEQGNRYQLYNPSMDEKALNQLMLETDLRKVLDREELTIYYQPQVDIKNQQVVGLEALLRWNHPEKGLISPIEFIPLAEETGMIVPIGEWVLRTACEKVQAIRNRGHHHLSLSVNLSLRQFQQNNLVKMVERIIKETNFNPAFLTLEITESMTADIEKTMVILQNLRELGVKISIDDFGTGYSSLSYLNMFPLDALKIDKSFVQNKQQTTIVNTIISMAHNLGLKVVAEGVETEEQLDYLKKKHCDQVQGFLYSRPLNEDEIIKYLEAFEEKEVRSNTKKDRIGDPDGIN